MPTGPPRPTQVRTCDPMRRKTLLPLIIIMLVAYGGLAATLILGNSPQLGLDLQGGVSVVLAPTGNATGQQLDQALEIIRNRVDALGVAEPDITRQGDAIVVQLPGVRNRDRALALVGQTAELRFRPVLQEAPVDPEALAEAQETADAAAADAVGDPTTTTTAGEGGATSTTTTAPTTTTSTPDEAAFGLVEGESAAAAVPQQEPTTTAPPATTTTTPGATTTTAPAQEG